MDIKYAFNLRLMFLVCDSDEFIECFNYYMNYNKVIYDINEMVDLYKLKGEFDKSKKIDIKTKTYLLKKIYNLCKISLFAQKNNYDEKFSYDDILIKHELDTDKLSFSNSFPKDIIKNINYIPDKYDYVENKNIISIDKNTAVSLDGAFSIEKVNNNYILDVYISDVVSFLNYNRELAQVAYDRATNHYIKSGNCTTKIMMLPQNISDVYLSLNGTDIKNVIHFTFVINNKGCILNNNVKLSSIRLNCRLTNQNVKSILISNGNDANPLYKDLSNLKRLSKILCNKHKRWAKGYDYIETMASIPSILVNYFVSQEANFAIYRVGKVYLKKKTKYTHSSTPIRRIVSDINLAIYLNQKGIGNINDRDIYRIEDNLDEIIEHLNKVEKIKNFISYHPEYVMKKIKKYH